MEQLAVVLFFLFSIIISGFALGSTNREPTSLTSTNLLLPSSPYCTDTDSDGFYAEENCGTELDCDDDNADAFSGQIQAFTVPRANGSFDYNCIVLKIKQEVR